MKSILDAVEGRRITAWVKTNDPRRYDIPRKRNVCNKLYRIDGKTYTDTENLLECWRDHFCSIGKS